VEKRGRASVTTFWTFSKNLKMYVFYGKKRAIYLGSS
jgi:hypothetical protein